MTVVLYTCIYHLALASTALLAAFTDVRQQADASFTSDTKSFKLWKQMHSGNQSGNRSHVVSRLMWFHAEQLPAG